MHVHDAQLGDKRRGRKERGRRGRERERELEALDRVERVSELEGALGEVGEGSVEGGDVGRDLSCGRVTLSEGLFHGLESLADN